MRCSSALSVEVLESRVFLSAAPATTPTAHGGSASALHADLTRRRPATPPDVQGTYNGTVVRAGLATAFTLQITSEDAEGKITGTMTFTTEGGETSTPITGTIRGKAMRFAGTFGDAGVFGRGRLTPGGKAIRGMVAQEVIIRGRRHPALLRSRMNVEHQAPSAGAALSPDPGTATELPPCGCGGGGGTAA